MTIAMAKNDETFTLRLPKELKTHLTDEARRKNLAIGEYVRPFLVRGSKFKPKQS